jgi:hypothetical protein
MKRNLGFWERNPQSSPRVEKSLENPEESLRILLLCEFSLRELIAELQ